MRWGSGEKRPEPTGGQAAAGPTAPEARPAGARPDAPQHALAVDAATRDKASACLAA